MICVCVPIALKKNEVYITLIVQCSPFPSKGFFLLDLLATSFSKASNHQPMTINQIQEKHRFDMEYMPRQTKNLTILPLANSMSKPLYKYKNNYKEYLVTMSTMIYTY